MLGTCYPVSFFRNIKNDKVRSALERITYETIEDLEYYQKVLTDFGCKVIRPEIDPNLDIMEYVDPDGKIKGGVVPRSPMQPRDGQLVVGDRLVFVNNDHPSIKNALLGYNNTDVDMVEDDRSISAPCYTLVGKDLYADRYFNDISDEHAAIMTKHHPIRFNTVRIGGHNDGCFHTLKPGAILSLQEIQTYGKTFPNWDVCVLPNQSWALVEGFLEMKDKVNGKWWVPGEEHNDELIDFVETWLTEWVGYVEESVFDVNVLMLDEHHVCVNNHNRRAFTFFKKHNIEPIIVPFRHRYFWDGGLHCLTLDLYREGEMEDYFPDRLEPIHDEGFD